MNSRVLKYVLPVFVFGIILITSGFRKKNNVQFVQPKGWPKPVYDFLQNEITDAGFSLGKKLFYDPILSVDNSISCASCHAQWSAFTHTDHALSHGVQGLKGKRNSLTLFNLAWNKAFMWDGGVNHLEVQPLAPLTNTSEMGTTLEAVVRKLDTAKGYKSRFYATFGDSAITGQRVLKAIAQFTGMFESFNSRYDKYMRHEPGGALSEQELNGLKIFRKNCASCHEEPLFTNYSYQNTGLPVDPELNDYGRMNITRDAQDSLKFRVPSLRNVVLSYPYLHDGRFRSIRQVLDHYTDGVVQGATLAEQLRKPMVLSDADKEDILAFLKTLTDAEFLSDKRFAPDTSR